MGPLKAMDLLLSLPLNGATLDLCYETNPNLWNAWCNATNRNAEQVSRIYTEHDVACFAEILLKQYIRDRIVGNR
jgi:hypothetical protein